MVLHKLLLRQLNRLELSQDSLPDIKKWHQFLERVNKSYDEADQERYPLDRSMEISSRELFELNEKLETAQQMAHLGYWYHNVATGENSWSKELYKMFDLGRGKPVPDISGIFELVHEIDRPRLMNYVDKAFSEGKEYEIEMRMKPLNGKGEYRWYHVIGKPFKNKEGKIDVLTGIAMDITRRKHVEEEIASLHQQLLTSARRAGMAEVATSVLHSVGNILNSANVSMSLIQENMNESYFQKLFSIQELLAAHHSDLIEFITGDPQGKLILQYLDQLIKKIKDNHYGLAHELGNLKEHINHIKDITEAQQSLTGPSGIIENVQLADLIEIAIKMSGNEYGKKGILVIKEIEDNITIKTDKSKLLQILVNLIRNAKEALLEKHDEKHKQLSITMKNNASTNNVDILIKDNGVGITTENIQRIFTFGFTTKKSGHGFGLHSSALSAKDLNAILEVKSEGLDRGATLILSLPIQSERIEHEQEKQFENNHYR